MNKKQPSIWLQVTAGQGPKECGWVVAQVTQRILQEAEDTAIQATIVESLAYDKMLRNQALVVPETFRSVLIKLEGEGITEYVKTWCGSVKWQGESAYREKHKRVNWFVGVVQLMPHDLKAIDEHQLGKDVVIETMRSSGPGGQHVNKTSSGVRITHQPSGIQVRVDSDRSQHRNKALALERLKMILAEDIQQEARQQTKDRWMNHYQVSRGNPVRVFAGAEFKEKR